MRHTPVHATTEIPKSDPEQHTVGEDMPRRRPSISSSLEWRLLAAAAWPPLSPPALALGLALFWAMPHGVLSRGQLTLPPLPNSPPPINMRCDEILYPFGLRGKSAPGFEVTCGPNREAMLPIGEHRFRIDQLSLQEGYIVILAGPIYQSCYGRNGQPASRDTGIGPMNLTGTPFFFSKRNRLVATGCNYHFLVSFTSSSSLGKQAWSSTASGCDTKCTGNSDAIINGSCPGPACCKANMPMDGAAQEFTLTNFNKTSANVTEEEAGTCSAAFILDQEEQIFKASGGDQPMPLKDALVPLGERRMVLDWVIGRINCEQAPSNNFRPQYHCNNVSSCVNGPSGAGYFCRCNAGYDPYDGNPYKPGGCKDVNECRDINSHNCSIDACINTPEGFNCSCPKNKTGDGYRTGTGCTESLLSTGPPTQNQPQGQDVCNHPEKNPCVYPKFCIGAALCACPEGMNGDGRKEGSGCKKKFPLEIALGVGLALMVIVATILMCYYWTMKKRKASRKRAELFRKNGGLLLQQRFSTITSQGEDSSAKIFSAEELKNATNNYNESRILGRGGSGMVYKGVLPNNTMVAIKKSILFDESQVDQFVNEITILSQTDHPNVVKLLGCCLETRVPLLVYEFIPNGTLFQHIHNSSSLTWEDCIRIAEESAEALAYLHSASSTPIIHRDIKSSNILLDENFVAKISDFGASRSVPFDQTHVTTLIQGTLGYLDPEYFQSSQLTEKSDVYSFGVVLAELLTRQKPISVGRPEEACNLAMHIVILFNERRLLQEIEPKILAEAGEQQIYAFAQLSVRCLNSKGEERPVMKEVASVLHKLRESFAKEKTIRRNDESIQVTDEQESVHSEARPISSLQSSEETTTQYSLPAEILSSSHLAR